MDQHETLAEEFERNRPRVRAVAVRMLGSGAEADDAVQETWLRLARNDAGAVDNLGAWLTTVVSRVCLDQLRSRKARREEDWDRHDRELAGSPGSVDPEEQALLADSVGAAMLAVLDTLPPAERVAFVLHDMFAVPFEQVAPLVDRSPAATRQLASRGRRRVQGRDAVVTDDAARQREVVRAFLAASREGDFAGLIALLDPSVVLRADPAVVAFGAAAETFGRREVAETFSGRARAAVPALIDGRAGAVWSSGGSPRVVFDFTVVDGLVVAIDLLADPETLAVMDLC